MFVTQIPLFWFADLADESPPEPAPPEVPPRGPSLHHPLQGHSTLRGRSMGSVNYSLSSGPGDADNLDDPDYCRTGGTAAGGSSCVFLSQGRMNLLLSSSADRSSKAGCLRLELHNKPNTGHKHYKLKSCNSYGHINTIKRVVRGT
jgi:hypothetical protein